jgi:ketosteroid isomerase-like protein
MNDLADRFFAAVSAGDEATLTELYAPDARIWHNDKGTEETVTENLRVLRWLSRTLVDMRYELPGHGLLEVAACLFVEVRDGRIARIDEYVDSAATRPLREFTTGRKG